MHGQQWAEVPWPDGGRGAADFNILASVRRHGRKQLRPLPEPVAQVQPALIQEGEREIFTGSSFQDTLDTVSQMFEDEEEQENDLAAKAKEVHNKALEAGEVEMAEEQRQVGAAPKTKRKKTKKATVKQAGLAWSEVRKLAPNNKLVLRAEIDEELIPAICIAFKQVPKSDWESDAVESLVENIQQLLEENK